MELRTFIAQSLVQIVQGIVDSADEISRMGGAVSPAYSVGNDSQHIGKTKADSKPVHSVDFDVALNASSGSSKENDETLSVASVAVNRSASTSNATEELSSRIRFTVPLQYPTDPKSQAAADAKVEQRRREGQMMSRRIHGSDW